MSSVIPTILADNPLTVNDIALELYPQGRALLAYFQAHPGVIHSAATLVTGAWGRPYIRADDSTIAYYISHVRRALGDRAFKPRFIRTHKAPYRSRLLYSEDEGREGGYEWIGPVAL